MMQQSSLVMFSSTLVAALTLLTQATTFAADQPTGAAPVATAAKKAVIETMIVTAEKRETSLQKAVAEVVLCAEVAEPGIHTCPACHVVELP